MANNQYVNKVQFVRNGTTETLIDISDTTATAADVSQGAYFYLASGEKVEGTSTGGTMVIRDSQDSHGGTVRAITAGTVVQGTKSITANGTYDVAAYADAQVNVPSAEPSLQSKTATPTTAQQTIMPDSGYDGLSSVTVNAVQSGSLRETETYQVAPEISVNSSGLVTASVNQSDTTNPVYSSGWIEDDAAQYVTVSAYSTSQLPTQAATTITPSGSSQTAVAAGKYTTGAVTVAAVPTGEYDIDVVSPQFYNDGGVRKWRARADMEVWDGWLPSGSYYGPYMVRNAVASNTTVTPTTSAQTIGGANYMMEGPVTVAAMPTGTAGTPTATKGTISNHSVSVTPSVTNTTGYITGGTKSGTAVTVAASELVSGTLEVTESGTYDVTNYASADVSVSGGATNFVQGTFTTSSTTGSAQTIDIPYTGTGYPIIAHVEVSGGFNNSNNTEWYNAVRRFSVGLWHMSKSNHNANFKNYDTGDVLVVWKNSSTEANQYTNDHSVNTYYAESYGASSLSSYETVTFTSKTQLSVFVSDSGTRGLMPGISYSYFIVYSE